MDSVAFVGLPSSTNAKDTRQHGSRLQASHLVKKDAYLFGKGLSVLPDCKITHTPGTLFNGIVMVRLVVGLLLCGLASAQAQAGDAVCLHDKVALNRFTRQAFEAEFRQLLADMELRTGPCSATSITLVVSMHPPQRYRNALGLAYRHGERILPELRIYVQPVLNLLGNERSAGIVGRALARVAAHEVTHFRKQQIDHDHEGLMKVSFSGAQLAAHAK
jgi:hypothetical protein